MSRYRNVIMTPCRWETNAIAEFVSFYQSIGFDHVYIYCNDDSPLDLYGALLPWIECDRPFVTFVHFGLLGQHRQMMLHWLTHYRHEAARVAFFDADEYLCMPGLHDINRLLESLPIDPDTLYFNWSPFGPSGYAERPEGSILLRYRRRERLLHPFTKILVKTSIFSTEWLAHNPLHDLMHGNSTYLDQFRSINVLGRDMARYYETFPHDAEAYLHQPEIDTAMRAVAVLNHYSIRSERDYLRRFERGTKGEHYGQEVWKRVWDEGKHVEHMTKMSEVLDDELARFWERRLTQGRAELFCVLPRSPNLALNRPAMQSSISEWSIGRTPEEDAANAVNGRITGRHQFHTSHEDRPWWQCDLGSTQSIREIRVFNRLDVARERAQQLELLASENGKDWKCFHQRTATNDFGGADGYPFLWQGEQRLRFLRLQLAGRNFLHLDQVEVYGDGQSGDQ